MMLRQESLQFRALLGVNDIVRASLGLLFGCHDHRDVLRVLALQLFAQPSTERVLVFLRHASQDHTGAFFGENVLGLCQSIATQINGGGHIDGHGRPLAPMVWVLGCGRVLWVHRRHRCVRGGRDSWCGFLRLLLIVVIFGGGFFRRWPLVRPSLQLVLLMRGVDQ